MRQWTPEDRARQSELIRQHKPWLNSTGPRTEVGKDIAATNSRTHGMTSKAAQDFFQALREHRQFLKKVEMLISD